MAARHIEEPRDCKAGRWN